MIHLLFVGPEGASLSTTPKGWNMRPAWFSPGQDGAVPHAVPGALDAGARREVKKWVARPSFWETPKMAQRFSFRFSQNGCFRVDSPC